MVMPFLSTGTFNVAVGENALPRRRGRSGGNQQADRRLHRDRRVVLGVALGTADHSGRKS
jgi:hypothetical protein